MSKSKEIPHVARWVHNTEHFIRRRVQAIMADNQHLGPSQRIAIETAAERAQAEASVAILRYPGNTQRVWNGRHAEPSAALSNSDQRTIKAAIAKRERRLARVR